MNTKVREREKAEELRRLGYSYNEILKEVKVAKSSLSLWLKDLPLTESEKHYLKDRKDSNISRGRIRAASANRMRRVVRDGFLHRDAKREFEKNIKSPLFQVGIALYWAEGGKRSNSFAFMNSDPAMIKLMIRWVESYLGATKKEVGLRLYAHKPYMHENYEVFWSKETGIPLEQFKKTVYKATESLVKKRPGYMGCMRIELGKVSYFRRLQYWQQLLIGHYADK